MPSTRACWSRQKVSRSRSESTAVVPRAGSTRTPGSASTRGLPQAAVGDRPTDTNAQARGRVWGNRTNLGKPFAGVRGW